MANRKSASEKRVLREDLKQRLESLTDAEVRTRSEKVCENLFGCEAFRHAGTLMLYMPLPGEVDLNHVILRCFQENRTVCVPKVDWEHKKMWPVQIRTFDDRGFINDRYGLRTPEDGVPIPFEMLDLIVIPAIAFDTDGYRLGRGAGYYDRFLGQSGISGRSIGLCFDEQIIDRVPRDAHDVPMNLVVTDRRVIPANPVVRRPRP